MTKSIYETNVDFFAALYDLRLVQCGGTLKMQETLADCELDTTQILHIVDLKCFSTSLKPSVTLSNII